MDKEKIVKMDYPDGETHDVSFKEYCPIKIGNTYCYVARYYDYAKMSDMITLITYIDNNWCKVPLNTGSYRFLIDYIDSNRDRIINAKGITLGGHISVTMPLELVARQRKDSKKPQIAFGLNYYVPLSTSGSVDKRNVFKHDGCKMENGKPCHIFNKEPIYCEMITREMFKQEKGRSYINNRGAKEYDYDIDIPVDSSVIKREKLNDGRIIETKYYLVPDRYLVKAFYSDFIDQDDYDNSRRASTIKVPTYVGRDNHTDLVWMDAGKKELDLIFDNKAETKLHR